VLGFDGFEIEQVMRAIVMIVIVIKIMILAATSLVVAFFTLL
jgi:hypothetical protein